MLRLTVQTYVLGTPSLQDNLSEITKELGSPKLSTRSFIATKMGLPPTPEQKMNLVNDKNLNDAGYDSNNYMGLARNAPGMVDAINVDKDKAVI